uniref:Ig-like domain-containing protein n=1 Tax=Gasterosteus aculeatus aculeatus TaxID=481459 RepID=A0AAQ4QWR0_GASAC
TRPGSRGAGGPRSLGRVRFKLNAVFLRPSGASPAVCPIPLIEAVEGDNVTLPCHLYPEVNAEGHTFDWKRDGLEKWVYVYRDKKPVEDDQRDEYKNRTRVDPMGLKRGNMSLLIFPVKLSDSGSYRCFNVLRRRRMSGSLLVLSSVSSVSSLLFL